MSKNLAIDIGNTSAKIYVFEGRVLIDKIRYSHIDRQCLCDVARKYQIDSAIISCVGTVNFDVEEYLRTLLKGRVITLNSDVEMPITIKYATPKSLGSDRIAVAVGANSLSPNRSVMIVDVGTAMTIDYVDAGNNYLGGNISPGLFTRLNALNHYTNKLPLVSPDGETPEIGYSTETAIRSGVIRGMAHEISGYMSDFSNMATNPIAYITGGDAKYLAKWIKNCIFDEQNLLAIGLNTILLYNEEN